MLHLHGFIIRLALSTSLVLYLNLRKSELFLRMSKDLCLKKAQRKKGGLRKSPFLYSWIFKFFMYICAVNNN